MTTKKKMTLTVFTKKRGLAVSTISRALKGERNLCADNAEKVSRALGTTKGIWRNDGWTMARVAAWEAYCEKFNGRMK